MPPTQPEGQPDNLDPNATGQGEGGGTGDGGQPAQQDPPTNPEEQTVEIDGEAVPVSQIKQWKKSTMLESDYRKKTMALAEKERQLARSGAPESPKPVDTTNPEVVEAVEVLKGLGFTTQEEVDARLAAVDAAKKDEQELDAIIAANPDLSRFETAIKAIGKNSGQAWEDIITKHGFKEKTALQRAQNTRPIVGTPSPKTVPQDKSPSEMTDAEYDDWKAKKGIGKRRTVYTRRTR